MLLKWMFLLFQLEGKQIFYRFPPIKVYSIDLGWTKKFIQFSGNYERLIIGMYLVQNPNRPVFFFSMNCALIWKN